MSLLIKNAINYFSPSPREVDVFIEEGVVRKIGKKLNVKAKELLDAKGRKAVLPGLVNSHCHAAMVLFRGYADDLPLDQWLQEKIWPLEAKLTKEDVYWGTKLAILEMIKTGTVCFNDMYWMEEAAVEAAEEMGIRAKIGLVLMDFSPLGSKEHIESIFNKLKTRKLKTIQLSIAPHAIYTVSKENFIWAKNFARKNNLLLHTHISETEKEVRDCLAKYKLRPIEYLDNIKILDKNTFLAHSVWLSDKEIKILGQRKCNVVYNPTSNMKLGVGGTFPYLQLKQAGVNIVLGSDGAASNNNLDMLEAMKVGALLQKHKEADSSVVGPEEALSWATSNARRIKSGPGLNVKRGWIFPGMPADLILVDLNQVSFYPGHNFFSDLVFSANGGCVTDTIVNGRVIMRDRRVAKEDEILRKSKLRAKHLL